MRRWLPLVAPLMLAAPAGAHHSFAMFNQEKSITIEGTVKEFQFTNPHCWIQLMVARPGAAPVEWSIEMGGPGSITRQGWKPRTLAAGDKVTVTIHPLRSGQPGGSFMSIILPSGQRLGGDQIRSQLRPAGPA